MSTLPSHSITIVVLTHNRTDFLRRLLYYFSALEVDQSILIVDSSKPAICNENSLTIARSGLKVQHIRDTSGISTKCSKAMQGVTTPFSVFCADDDFLMPDSAGLCAKFLADNPSYNCASGTWVQVEPHKDNRCYQLRCCQIDQDDPLVRFRELATHWFSTAYAVYRTDTLARACDISDDSTDYRRARIYPEKLLAQLSVVYGKFAVLPQLHYLFELHGGNQHAHVPLIADAAGSGELYDRFADALAKEMMGHAGASEESSRRLIEQCFGMWNAGISMKFDHRPAGLKRYAAKLRKHIGMARDRLVRDPVNIWQARPLAQGQSVCEAKSWKLAYQLIGEFPHGMKATEYSRQLRSVA